MENGKGGVYAVSVEEGLRRGGREES